MYINYRKPVMVGVNKFIILLKIADHKRMLNKYSFNFGKTFY